MICTYGQENYAVTITTEDLVVTEDDIWAGSFNEAEDIALTRFETEYGDISTFHEVAVTVERASA